MQVKPKQRCLLTRRISLANLRAVEVIREYIRRHELTQKEFGRRVGVSQSMVSQIVTKRLAVSPRLAKRIEKRTRGELRRVDLCREFFE